MIRDPQFLAAGQRSVLSIGHNVSQSLTQLVCGQGAAGASCQITNREGLTKISPDSLLLDCIVLIAVFGDIVENPQQTGIGAGLQTTIAARCRSIRRFDTVGGILHPIDCDPMPGDGSGAAAVLLNDDTIDVIALFTQTDSLVASEARRVCC